MKVTSSNARVDSAGRHNDRNFDLRAAAHIDKEMSSGNQYYTYNGDTEHTFYQIETEYYKEHFSEHIKKQNKKNKEQGHAGRNQTIKDYYTNKRTRPEDKILQIGDKNRHATAEELWDCALEYKDRFNTIYGEHCQILDMALHVDEATPHVHIRRVWITEDENGDPYVAQGKALDALGIMPPDPSQPEGRWNNAKITFTYSDRALFEDVCIEKGLNIERDNHQKGRHLPINQYKEKKAEEHVRELEVQQQKIQSSLNDVDMIIREAEDYFTQPFFEDKYIDEIEENKNKERAERIKKLIEIYNKEVKQNLETAKDFQAAVIRSQIDSEIRSMEEFLEDHGLLNEYREQREYDQKQKIKEREKDDKVFF